MVSIGSHTALLKDCAPMSRLFAHPTHRIGVKAAAAQGNSEAFRRPDVPVEKKSHREQPAHSNPQSFQPSSALPAADFPRSPLEQVWLHS